VRGALFHSIKRPEGRLGVKSTNVPWNRTALILAWVFIFGCNHKRTYIAEMTSVRSSPRIDNPFTSRKSFEATVR
jgi:hypothetical protein